MQRISRVRGATVTAKMTRDWDGAERFVDVLAHERLRVLQRQGGTDCPFSHFHEVMPHNSLDSSCVTFEAEKTVDRFNRTGHKNGK